MSQKPQLPWEAQDVPSPVPPKMQPAPRRSTRKLAQHQPWTHGRGSGRASSKAPKEVGEGSWKIRPRWSGFWGWSFWCVCRNHEPSRHFLTHKRPQTANLMRRHHAEVLLKRWPRRHHGDRMRRRDPREKMNQSKKRGQIPINIVFGDFP